MSDDPDDPAALLELKTRLILYLADPPGPVTARRVYDLYMARYGDVVTSYGSTAIGDLPDAWTPAARARFEQQQLPALRQRLDWGYQFGSDRPTDARSFLFHGFRPASEPGMASLIRFDFEWDFSPAELRSFAAQVLDVVECVCGTAGYVLNSDVNDDESFDLMFAWAMRYWGAQAQELEADAASALDGFPCVSWLTIIGPGLRARDPAAVDAARAVAHASFEAGGHVVTQAEERPRLIDRNRREPLGNYSSIAEALLPLQVKEHDPFGGDRWDEDNTMRYLRRFTHPNAV
jgi:hypothetical protein